MGQTPKAVEKLKVLVDSPQPRLLRIDIKQRGCAGQSYSLDYVEKPGNLDESIEQDGVKVLIASNALLTIIGSEMDYKEDRLSSQFVFHNPNVKESCGCGLSFTTTKQESLNV